MDIKEHARSPGNRPGHVRAASPWLPQWYSAALHVIEKNNKLMYFDRDLLGLFMDSRFQKHTIFSFSVSFFERTLCHHIGNNLIWSLTFMYSCLQPVCQAHVINRCATDSNIREMQLISTLQTANFPSSAQSIFHSNLLYPTFHLHHKYFNF